MASVSLLTSFQCHTFGKDIKQFDIYKNLQFSKSRCYHWFLLPSLTFPTILVVNLFHSELAFLSKATFVKCHFVQQSEFHSESWPICCAYDRACGLFKTRRRRTLVSIEYDMTETKTPRIICTDEKVMGAYIFSESSLLLWDCCRYCEYCPLILHIFNWSGKSGGACFKCENYSLVSH